MRPSMRRLTTITALSAMTAAATVTAGPAAAQGPAMHQVRYTVSTDAPFYAKIYYRDALNRKLTLSLTKLPLITSSVSPPHSIA